MKRRGTRRVVNRIAAPIVLIATAATTSVAAAPPALRIFVEYRAAATCPNRASFIALLLQRVAQSSLTDEPTWGRTMSITLTEDQDQFAGQMELDDGTGRPVKRGVRAVTCDEVASAMALVAALAIEPLAVAPSRQSEEDVPAPIADGKLAPSSAELPASKPPPALANPPTSNISSHISISGRVSTVPKPSSPAPARTYVHDAGVALSLVNGLVGPKLAMGPSVAWGLAIKPSVMVLRIAAAWFDDRWTLGAKDNADNSHFRLIAGAAHVCVMKSRGSSSLFAGGVCLGPELGQYFAEGTPNATSAVLSRGYGMLWASALAQVHLRVQDDRLFFELAPTLRLPLVRRDFVAERPPSAIHSIPAAAVGANFAIGAVFR